MQAKGKTIQALDTKPKLFDDLIYYWNGFNQLSQGRRAGFSGPQSLALSDIVAWLDLYGIVNSDNRLEFYELMLAMDLVFMLSFSKRSKEKNANSSSSSRRKKGSGRSSPVPESGRDHPIVRRTG